MLREETKSTEMHREGVEFESFEKYLKRDVRLLRLAGLHSINGIFTGNFVPPKHWEAVTFAIGILNVFFVTACEMNTVVTVWTDDPNLSIRAATASLSGSLVFIKGLSLWFWRNEFMKLLRCTAVMWNNSGSRVRIIQENMKDAEKVRHVAKCYIIMVIALCSSFALRPWMLLLHYYWYEKNSNVSYDYTETVYSGTYPKIFTSETTGQYLILVAWEQFAVIFIGLYWMSTEVMFAQLAAHIAIQFRVLQHDLEYVTIEENDRELENEREIIDRLCQIAKRHRELYTYCELVESIFNPLIFLTMFLTSANMCFCAFRLQKEIAEGHWDEIIKNLAHVSIMIAQAFIYCGYADELTVQSGMMAQSAYRCRWTEHSKEFNVILHIIMMRSQRPFICTAYGFFAVNINKITTIANTAASYFTLLRSMA